MFLLEYKKPMENNLPNLDSYSWGELFTALHKSGMDSFAEMPALKGIIITRPESWPYLGSFALGSKVVLTEAEKDLPAGSEATIIAAWGTPLSEYYVKFNNSQERYIVKNKLALK